ncbi:FG-GAP repeat domain-containing protein [Streptomyces sp. NBC_00454]|uniref:FG-GAP repeat domain-containing protein n=1 Tax=Streptomyces sp. NBC_00454 TaxID=2975747 RepID=UPI0030E47709
MSRRWGRIAATGGWVAALLATGLGTAVPASADGSFSFTLNNSPTLSPDDKGFMVGPDTVSGTSDGDLVYAFATKPLTGQAGDGAGLPAGLAFQTVGASNCTPVTGYTAVYKCAMTGNNEMPRGPQIKIAADIADETTAYYGAVHLPRGGDLAEAVKQAQTAGATPADGTHGTAHFTVLTAEHVARNTATFITPDVPAGTPTKQTLRVHAVDKGRVWASFRQAGGQPDWFGQGVDITVTQVSSGAGAQCTLEGWYTFVAGLAVFYCDVTPGDVDITYTVRAAPGTESWKIDGQAFYKAYTYRHPIEPTTRGSFAIQGTPVRSNVRLMARDASGGLYEYQGTGKGGAPFLDRIQIGTGWGGYNAITKLSPLRDQNAGDLVARDADGVLWYYHGYPGDGMLADRVRLGAGWNTYNTLAGAGDLSGDRQADLLARDGAGDLWLYPGTGNPSAPFGDRIRIGWGWNGYNTLVGGSDLNGDWKPDLLARDGAGDLWLYPGTGNPSAPFGDRIRAGWGWNGYNQLVVPGDLNSDRNADLLARDGAGNLWLYPGTGNPKAPFGDRIRAGWGWNGYTNLI